MALTQLKTGAIADDAVTTDKLANAINTERTANTAKSTNATHTGEVTGSGALTITADAVTGAKIADDAIDSEHYADGSIDTAHIADNQITLAKMAGGTDGQIITYDASGDPVAVGPGTDGQVLTSTGAGSPPAFEDAAAGGKVLQIQSANNASSIQITSTSYVTTGLSVDITPTSASSKILISTSFSVYKSNAAAQVDTTLYRDSSNLGQATYGFGQVADLGNYGGINGMNLQYSDSPNTTSQVTYAVYGKVNSGHNFYVMGNNVQANITAVEYST